MDIRIDCRADNQLRPVTITPHYLKSAEGSVLIEMGDTKVICTASLENKVPPFLRGKGTGWVTAEYGMLPRSTGSRMAREASRGKQSGRTQEIQRLIGRSLRSIVHLKKLGERTVWLDCDVIQADGGTRTASITGAFVALGLALEKFNADNPSSPLPHGVLLDYVAAISVGIVNDRPMLDLNYPEDSTAHTDMNVVMTGEKKFIEVQGTAEKQAFSKDELDALLVLADKGISQLVKEQKKIITALF